MSCNQNTSNINKTFIVEGGGNDGFIEHTILTSYKGVGSNDMYLIWDDLSVESGSTLANDGRIVVVNGDFNNFGSYTGTGTVELITTNLEYILNYGNESNGNLIYYTNSPTGWLSGDTIPTISAATGNVLVTKEWVNLVSGVDNNDFSTGGTYNNVTDTIIITRNDGDSFEISGITDNYTTGATLIGNIVYFDREDSLSAYTTDLSGLTTVLEDGNGTTASGSSIDLGGTLSQSTIIIGGNQNLELGTSSSNLSNFKIKSTQADELYSVPNLALQILKNPGGFNVNFSDVNNNYLTTLDLNSGVFNLKALNNTTGGYAEQYANIGVAIQSANDGGGNKSEVVTTPTQAQVAQTVTGTSLTSGLKLDINTGYKFEDVRTSGSGLEYGADYSANYTNRSLVDKAFVLANDTDTFVTGATFSNNQLNITLNNGTSVETTIDNLSGLTVDGDVLINGDVNIIGSATTINSEQVLIKDNIITLNSNVTGSTTPVLNSGFEVLRGSGDTKSILWLENTDLWSVDDDLSVSGYVSGTTYYGDGSNLTGIDDTFVTGGTYSGSTIILNRNDGNTVNVTGITSDSIYTANGTLTGDRIVNLDSKSLTITGGTTNNATPLNFEFGGYWQGYTRWADSGAVSINVNSNDNALTIFNKVNSTNFKSRAGGGGYLGLEGGGTNVWRFNDGDTANSGVEIGRNAQKFYFGGGLIHNIQQGGAGSGVHFYQGGITGSLGYFIVGGNTRIGSEDISLQGNTLISKKLELSTTTDGFLMPRLTTAQKNAISSPDTNLMVFDTDLNSLQRYNGTIWVSQSNGYNLISVNDSNGTPTFYTDLQTAINATASKDTVYIHSDIQLTSSVTIPARSSLTIALNGHRIWGDTTLGDFYLFGMVNTSTERYLHINGGGVIETIGTATSGSDAAPFKFLNVGSGTLYCYFNDTQVKSENAYPFYTNGFTLLDGGHYYSTNNGMLCKVYKLINAYVDTAFRPALGIDVIDCTLISRSYGFFCDRSDSWIGNHISGPVTESGNYGLLFCYGSSTVVNNYLEQTNAAGRDALYVRGSDPRDGKITNNICINKGTGTGGNLVYGSCSDNYFYSALGTALAVGGNCRRIVKNICITDSTTSNALSSSADYTVGNTAICTDVSHTGAPIFVGGVTNEVFGNKAICYNPSTTNILLGSTGTIYLANNIMSSVGIGLDLNGNVNSMINTPDAFGNLKIG